jgi:hypothetical protein
MVIFALLTFMRNSDSGYYFHFADTTPSTPNPKGSKEVVSKYFMILIVAPDIMVLLAFFLLFWQLLKVFIEGHANMAKRLYIPNMGQKSCSTKFLVLLTCSYIIIEVTLLLVYFFTEQLTFHDLSL